MSALEAAPEGSAGAPSARDSAATAASPAASATAGAASGGGGAAGVVVAPPVVVVVPPPPATSPPPPSVSCPDVTAAAMSVLSAADAGSGEMEPGGDTSVTDRRSRRATAALAGDSRAGDPRLRPDPLWRRAVPRGIRDELIRLMQEELQRITGQEDRRHLRICAARYESYAWRKSDNHIRYFQKMGRRIDSLRDQPSFLAGARAARQESSSSAPSSSDDERAPEQRAVVDPSAHLPHSPSSSHHHHHRSSSSRRSRRHHRRPHPQSTAVAHAHLFPGIAPLAPSSSSPPASLMASSSTSPLSSSSSSPDALSRDERYFRKLRVMKAKYRDEVALVFRELCRVNTVIQHSASLRRHESNNLGDFLANLKKIIYLLEQQPDEPGGMIPARKRTLEYLDVVESHIQRKVLPILYRLRHTYSTILRPIVLNYLRNSGRFARR